MSLRLVCCVEAGRLEGETLLMCESLRHFGGSLAAAPITAYSPRAGEPPADATRSRLDDLDVELVDDELNTEHAFYPMANKLYAAADAERRYGEDSIAVLDSDAVFLDEPKRLDLAEGADAAAAPVGKVSEGTTGPDHRNEEYWQGLYALTGVGEPPWIETALRGRRIRGYWNSGLVATRREAGLHGEWLELFRHLLAEKRLPPSGKIDSLDQVSLALLLARRPGRVETLPWSYNYRITRRGRYAGEAGRADLDQLVHVHYMRSFYVERFLERVAPPVSAEGDRFRWLADRLPLEPRVVVDGDEPLTSRRIRRALGEELRRRELEHP